MTHARMSFVCSCFFFQAEDGIRDLTVTGVQTCALPISLFQFFILKSDHDCSTQKRECCQRIADGETSAKTPSEHFAKMRKIDWMTDAAVYPCSDQPLFTGHNFGNSAELLNAEMLPRFRIKPESDAEKKDGGYPSP